jgi:hypothetical protein
LVACGIGLLRGDALLGEPAVAHGIGGRAIHL